VRRRAPQQIDLSELQNAIGDMPERSRLPTDVQAVLTSLITRLIQEHADKSRLGSMAEIMPAAAARQEPLECDQPHIGAGQKRLSLKMKN
jgi:hypothetical protein